MAPRNPGQPNQGGAAARSKLLAMSETVLVIEDEQSIADFLTVTLESEGFQVVWACDAPAGLSAFEKSRPDAILLDMRLPGGSDWRSSGLEVLKSIRERSDVPILIVSVKDQESDKIAGLELGADDYITKPFSPRELVARLRTNLRKHQARETRTRVGPVLIDWQRAEVYREGNQILLTAREFELLRTLYQHRQRVLDRDALLERVWGYDFEGDDRVVDTTVKRLRRKVGQELIETVRGLGYRLVGV